MASAVTMPRLGLTMVEGTVVEWKAKPGDAVEKGQPLLVIESEKVEVEIEAFTSGTLAAIYVEPGTIVPIGSLLAAITGSGEALDREQFARSFVPETDGAPAMGESTPPQPLASGVPRETSAGAGLKVAPAARALAKKLGVTLEEIAGSGPGGRIMVEDVEKAGASASEPSLSIEVVGTGSPVLLIAGFGVDKSGWRPQVDALSTSHQVILFDHRGVASSRPAPDASLTIAAMAEDARSALHGHEPAVVVGASMGAAVAVELALAHPEVVKALVLVTPAIDPDARLDAVLRSWSEIDAAQADARARAMLPWLLSRRALAEAPKREAAVQALRAMAARIPLATARHHARALAAWLGTRTERLSRITAPTLVIAGEEDLLIPAESAKRIAERIAGARYECIAGAGHAVTIEQAPAVNRLISESAASP
jgi:pimeloyl-ACP methyl ester carboxylesterase